MATNFVVKSTKLAYTFNRRTILRRNLVSFRPVGLNPEITIRVCLCLSRMRVGENLPIFPEFSELVDIMDRYE